VCLLAAPYNEVVAAVEDLTDILGATERAAVFGGNAAALYRLEPRGEAP